MADKAPDAFRTISEVSEWLDTPTYVLRFWESKFAQIKPVKRAGGRRYYRPEDMQLLGGIKKLLHFDELTIKDAKKLIKDKGIKHVMSLSPDLDTPIVSPERADKEKTAAEIDDLVAQKAAQPRVDVRVVKKAKVAEDTPVPKPEDDVTEVATATEQAEVKTPEKEAAVAEAEKNDTSSDTETVGWEQLDPRIPEPITYRIAAARNYAPEVRKEIAAIYADLRALRDRMQSSGPQA